YPSDSGSSVSDASRIVVHYRSTAAKEARQLLIALDERYPTHAVLDVGAAANRESRQRVFDCLTPEDVVLILVDPPPESPEDGSDELDFTTATGTQPSTIAINVRGGSQADALELLAQTWDADESRVIAAVDELLAEQTDPGVVVRRRPRRAKGAEDADGEPR